MVVNAVDGTKIRSASSRERMVGGEDLEKKLEKLDRSVADFMTEVERQEQEEVGEYEAVSEFRSRQQSCHDINAEMDPSRRRNAYAMRGGSRQPL